MPLLPFLLLAAVLLPARAAASDETAIGEEISAAGRSAQTSRGIESGKPRPSPYEAKISAIVSRRLKPGGPGVVVAVVKDGEVVFTGAYGYSDIAKKTPLTPNMRFDLASVSKQFTAMAVMMLAERGQIDLDAPAENYFREFAQARDQRARTIRVVDLLQMVGGLADYTEGGTAADYKAMTNEKAAAAMLAKQLMFKPRTKYEYSNTAYSILGLIVKRVSGRGLGEFLKANVYAPLGMTRSLLLEHPGQAIDDRVAGYAGAKKGGFVFDRNDSPQAVGDGNMFSTAGDLALWDKALLAHPPVSAAMLERAWTSGTLIDGKSTGYGFGWVVDGRVVHHAGGWSGTSTYNVIHRDKKLAVIVLANDADFPETEVGDAIAKLWL